MRGDDVQQTGVFSYISAEERVPEGHPVRPVREMVDAALKERQGTRGFRWKAEPLGRAKVKVIREKSGVRAAIAAAKKMAK